MSVSDGPERGWDTSAGAWIALVDEGDPSRELLLDPVMLDLCGDVVDLRVLDAGCGEGRFSRMLAQRGARVVALDPTALLIREVARRSPGAVRPVRGSANSLPFADAVFDLVVSYIVLVDIADYRAAIGEMARVLRPGGQLIVANISFMSAGGPWVRDEQGRRVHYPMDRYLEEYAVPTSWRGIEVVNWHRPLGAYMNAFLAAGLTLTDFLEPAPRDAGLRSDPRFDDWYRVPNFVVMRWQR